MTFQSGIGQQLAQRTAQQRRPQIRILVTGRQFVDADQDDLAQDDDLAEKDTFLFGTHGAKEMPRSSVDVDFPVM